MHCLMVQLLMLWCGSSFPKLLLSGELCWEMFVLHSLLFLVVPSMCCCLGLPLPLTGATMRPKVINPAKLIWLGPGPLECLVLPVVLCPSPDVANFHPALYLSISCLVELRSLVWGIMLSRLPMCFAFIKLLGGLQYLILVSVSNG